MNYIDNFLNRITMYRLTLYVLTALIAIAAVCGALGFLPYSPFAILFSAVLITGVCWAANEACAKIFSVAPNVESVYITAFILTLIITPIAPSNVAAWPVLIVASVLAMASKYIVAVGKKHIFNPAAFGVLVTGMVLGHYASWWVGGNLVLLPFVLVGGLLVVRKVRRFDLFLTFAAVSAVGIAVSFLPHNPLDSIWQTFLHSSLLFMGTIMLTEPATTPPTRLRRIVYGALVGVLFIPDLHILSFYTSPELALVFGNIYSYIVSPKGRRLLKLVESKQIANGVREFVFVPDTPLAFSAGQYLEWTAPHKNPDASGNRRYFTIASSPTEKEIRLGVRVYDHPSSFKKALQDLQTGETVFAGQLAGEFTLPKDPTKKLVFIAGGIGVTPFRAMVQYMLDTKQKRDVVLFYAVDSEDEIAYKPLFDRAHQEFGMKAVYVVGKRLDAGSITNEVPDYRERMFYISGPHAMVEAYKKLLRELGIPHRNIKVDFFPGFY